MRPVLFSTDFFGIHIDVISYVVFNLLLNPITMILLGYLFLKKSGVPAHKAFISLCLVTVSGVIGARITHVLLSYKHYMELGVSPFSLNGGFTMFGGFVLSVPVILWLCRRLEINIWVFLDAICPGWALGIFFNKIGCFLNGCCFGVPTYVPWGVVYPDNSFPHLFYYSANLSQMVYAGGILPYRIHPVQLYESAVGLTGFIILVLLFRKKIYPGLSFAAFAVIYSMSRFIFNTFRAIPVNISASPMMVLWLYGASFCAALLVFGYRYRLSVMAKKENNRIIAQRSGNCDK